MSRSSGVVCRARSAMRLSQRRATSGWVQGVQRSRRHCLAVWAAASPNGRVTGGEQVAQTSVAVGRQVVRRRGEDHRRDPPGRFGWPERPATWSHPRRSHGRFDAVGVLDERSAVALDRVHHRVPRDPELGRHLGRPAHPPDVSVALRVGESSPNAGRRWLHCAPSINPGTRRLHTSHGASKSQASTTRHLDRGPHPRTRDRSAATHLPINTTPRSHGKRDQS
jgi:hypothetical protein